MALARIGESIVEGLFGDIVPSVRNAVRGYTMFDDEPMPSRLVKPEIMTGTEGTSRVMDMPEFQGVTQAERQTNLELATQMAEEGADNRDIAALILDYFGKGDDMIEYVTDRPGHDRRYAIDASKIKGELGWEPSVTFEEGLAETVEWYLSNSEWLDEVTSGEYQKYYDQMYADR